MDIHLIVIRQPRKSQRNDIPNTYEYELQCIELYYTVAIARAYCNEIRLRKKKRVETDAKKLYA